MDDSENVPDEERGLYPKYRALKIVSEIDTEGIQNLEEVTAPFFLIKFDDEFAHEALLAYASACEEKYPQLAYDLRKKLLLDDARQILSEQENRTGLEEDNRSLGERMGHPGGHYG